MRYRHLLKLGGFGWLSFRLGFQSRIGPTDQLLSLSEMSNHKLEIDIVPGEFH